MDKQALFDDNYRAFVINKEPLSFDTEENTCLYRGPNGTKCGIGRLIPDEIYHKSIEGNGIQTLLDIELYHFLRDDEQLRFREEFAKHIKCEPIKENWRFLSELQQCHDSNAINERDGQMINRFPIYEKLADKWNLQIPTS